MLRFSFHALADSKARSDGFPEASYHHFMNSESANEWNCQEPSPSEFKLNNFNNLGLIWYPIPALGSPVYDFQPQVWQSDMTCFGRALAEEAAAAAAAKTLARMPKDHGFRPDCQKTMQKRIHFIKTALIYPKVVELSCHVKRFEAVSKGTPRQHRNWFDLPVFSHWRIQYPNEHSYSKLTADGSARLQVSG